MKNKKNENENSNNNLVDRIEFRTIIWAFVDNLAFRFWLWELHLVHCLISMLRNRKFQFVNRNL